MFPVPLKVSATVRAPIEGEREISAEEVELRYAWFRLTVPLELTHESVPLPLSCRTVEAPPCEEGQEYGTLRILSRLPLASTSKVLVEPTVKALAGALLAMPMLPPVVMRRSSVCEPAEGPLEKTKSRLVPVPPLSV